MGKICFFKFLWLSIDLSQLSWANGRDCGLRNMLVLKLRLVQLNSPPTLCLFKCSLVSLILVLELRPGVYTCHCFRTRMRSLAKRYLPRWSRGLNPNFSLNSRKFDKSCLPSLLQSVCFGCSPRGHPSFYAFLLCFIQWPEPGAL